ncbi:MAG: magnesium transporter [Spirochaetaceae bacterium]|jgi:magnesium transporter|nr:magnesium transporter [Spirochaetaceae bacterium]
MKELILSLINTEPVDIVRLKLLLPDMEAADIADLFDELDMEKIIQIYRLLPKSLAAEVFAFIESDKQELIVSALTDDELADVVNHLFADDAADFVEEMPADVVKRVLKQARPDKRRAINHLLQYPEDSAGSLMTTEYVDLWEDATVREAFDVIRETGLNKETIYTCYVIRRDRLLVGVVSVKTLLLARPDDLISEIMDNAPEYCHTLDDQEAVAAMFSKYDLLALPVADKEGRLVGIITVDDIVDVIQEENTEDIEKMNALAPSDNPYLKTGVFQLFRNRIVWLLVLMLSATITGAIISQFEDALAILPLLVAFIPMLMDTSGNAGAQASTLIIRGMALGEIELSDVLKVWWKELRVGILCGLGLGLVNFVRILISNSGNYILAATVTASLVFTVIIAKSVGCTLPMLARRLKLDPAIMASPMITTIVDALSLLIYFSLCKTVFHI